MVNDGNEETLVELKRSGELLLQLPHAVYPLYEYW